MTNLRFKDYTFRHNPRKIVVRYLKVTAQSRCYGFGASLQELGSGLTIVEGEGELFGSDALEQFLSLKKMMEQQGSGILSGAGIEPMYAVFDSLQMVGKGGDNTISYTFRFIQERKREE